MRSSLFATTAEGLVTRRPPGGWAWFTTGGFQDHFDQERIVRKQFPQQPAWDATRPAGRPGNEAVKILAKRHARAGRDTFLDRSKDPHDEDEWGNRETGATGTNFRLNASQGTPSGTATTLPKLPPLQDLPRD